MAETHVENEAIFVTLTLWKKGDKNFSKKELNPVKSVTVSNDKKTVNIVFADKTTKQITFN